MLEGRRIVITGGASGIGAALMEMAAARGAQVHCFDRVLPAAGVGTASIVDIANAEQIEFGVQEAAASMGGIDGLANVAGLSANAGTVAQTDLNAWRKIIDVNLMGTLLVTAAVLPHLQRANGASVVNVSSGAALRPFAGSGAYAAAKRGVLTLTQVWAMELGPDIRVNAVCPGAIDTPMLRTRNVQSNSDGRSALTTDMYALKRFGTADEVASAICFLLGADASFITGATLPVDGGRTYY